jgi:hypothetical protein
MAQTRPHCFSMVSYLLCMNPKTKRQFETSCTYGVTDEIRRRMFPENYGYADPTIDGL